LRRAKLVSLASLGRYEPAMEKEAEPALSR
jgi:hypothetical protein